jgi:hypothetical protein
MSGTSVRLKPIRVALEHLLLDPNNPRFAKSLNLRETVLDEHIPAAQEEVKNFFINERSSETVPDDDDSETEEGKVRIGDLVRSMQEIGFVPIDQIVVRKLAGSSSDYVVVEGNRRVSSAKYLRAHKPNPSDPEAKRRHKEVLTTIEELDVLLLDTEGLTDAEVNDQIGVILGLRHFGQVLPWGSLAKAINIYHEYVHTQPRQMEFRLDNKRVSQVVTRLSQTRAGVLNALKTYIAYRQLQEAFPNGPKPDHYSLLQACVINRKLAGSKFIEQDGNTFELGASSLENLNNACEFGDRDTLPEGAKILGDPKAVKSFAGLMADAASNPDSAVRAFAFNLREEVLSKERPLTDAVDHLRSFKSDRAWTDSLEVLLQKVIEPDLPKNDSQSPNEKRQLEIGDFQPLANDLLRLEDANKAFRNVRMILGI